MGRSKQIEESYLAAWIEQLFESTVITAVFLYAIEFRGGETDAET